ncbi:hypothetical protein [Ciceribacter sp. RN22]|uniref:hypothetical protein n=1 Tax=Ciceribacter sp. RN22 TaxID=2954932 RepID=UPI0020927139|nr:hypothetical protein [Ciceribacter sp. RN22]MCO6179948.1 hypothetical protein [Ciceribacter sp. RN22]
MRYFRCTFMIAGLLVACGPALSQDIGPSSTENAATEAQTLGDESVKDIQSLLTDLKRERDPEAASEIAAEITTHWNTSGSPTIDLLMQWASEAIKEKRNPAALDFLDQAITLKPDFVGAWNQRATLHYTMNNYSKAMSDIEHVLAIEPRHFGALAGMAAILAERGREEMSLKAWERYLEIYPTDREAQDLVTKLSEKLAGSRT